jgi:hypothetical protein
MRGQTRGFGKPALRAAVLPVVLAAAFLAVLASPGAVQAQTGSGEQLRAYIERTDELLDWASGLVADTNSEQARMVLEQAQTIQRRATALMERGRLLESFAVARRARDATWHAVRLAREAASLEERIRLRAERFADQHSQLLDRARDAGDQRALELLQRAGEQARRSQERFQQGDLELAWNLLEHAEELLRRAARVLAQGVGPERLRLEIERTHSLVEDAGERLGANAPAAAAALLAEAEDALARAEEASAQGDPGRALQMAGLARRLAQRAIAQVEPNADGAGVTRLLERFDERAGAVAEAVLSSGNEPAQQAFARARAQRDGAAQALVEGHAEIALRQVRAAHDLLDQVERMLR